VSGRAVKRLLEAEPLDERAEGRAWETARAAFVERERLERRRPRIRVALVISALAAVVAAASFSPPGRAVVNAVRRTIGIRHAQPALFELPAPGRLLVAGESGAWIVAADGSKRSLGAYPQAAWSPHGLFVVAAAANELAALEPAGTVRWTLARRQIRFPVWGGTRTDTRIAYLAGSRLHVVAGDSTGDVDMAGLPAAARVAPAWQPAAVDRHVLAYVTTRGRVIVVDTDSGSVRWTSAAYAGPHALAWSSDGTRLALAAATEVILFDARTGRATTIHVAGVSALAFSTDGRLALLRRHAVLLRERGRTRTLFVPPGAVAGLAWSPNGRWLLTGLPGADEWIFLQTRGGHRILAVSHITAQFGAFPTLSGWAS
jgi:WD domain, G-beta repeat